MTTGTPKYSVLEPFLEQRARLREELRVVDAAIAALSHGQEVDAKAASPAPPNEGSVDFIADDFEGLTAPARAALIVKKAGPILPQDMLKIMDTFKVGPRAGNRQAALIQSLNTRRRLQRDILHIGLGKWDATDRYSEDEIQAIKATLKDTNSRDKVMHRKKMLEGIKKRRSSGKHYGGPPKVMPEQWDLALAMLSDGETVWKRIHEAMVDISPEGVKPLTYPSIMNYRAMLLAGEPYPKKWAEYIDEKGRAAPSVKVRLIK